MEHENPSYFSITPDEVEDAALSEIVPNSTELASRTTSEWSPRYPLNNELSTFSPSNTSSKPRVRRLMSSGSFDANREMFLRGEPRPTDLAPEMLVERSSGDVGKEDNEMLLSENSARYYNCKESVEIGRQQRRHSIGTFGSRERSASTSSTVSFKEFIHQGSVDDHSIRHTSFPRKRCQRCIKGAAPKLTDMDDILIVFLKCSDAAMLWVEYFSTYFEQISKQASRKSFRIKYLSAEEVVAANENTKDLIEKSSCVKLQLVVVCPGFLDFIAKYSSYCSTLGKILLGDRTLALLLGVSDETLNDIHRTTLPTYFQWKRLSVGQDQDENFTKEFLSQAITILSKIWKQQCSVVNQEKSCFSVSPKKIRQGQNTLFIMLNYPLQKDDIVKVSVERNNELVEAHNVKRRNPYTIKVQVPEFLTDSNAIVNILVEKNGNIIGSRPVKCESKLRELEQLLRTCNNPVDFMCQCLGPMMLNKEQLDNWLSQAFQRNAPMNFSMLSNHEMPFSAFAHIHKHRQSELPTLLHLAARFGLEKLAGQLLECPGAEASFEIHNMHGLTAADLADCHGHADLAALLRNYKSMNEFSSAYSKLRELSQSTKTTDIDADGYLTPKTLEELYKICPQPRPVMTDVCQSPSKAETPETIETVDGGASHGYINMKTPLATNETIDDTTEKEPSPSKTDSQLQCTNQTKPRQSKTESEKSKVICDDKVQKELLEIINDFKNNVHSISQVEKLVDEWKNRNDVQKSFQEKQEQLKEMRQKYEKIQLEMKAASKKLTPFERVRKLFFKNKHSGAQKHNITAPLNNQSVRPVSNLSISSSESSGRSSTISGSSLGDSGTHSDNEERKNILRNNSDIREELNKVIAELNYSQIPAPKPLRSDLLENRKFETIEEKPSPIPDTLQLTQNEYYIQFPPSGLPIDGLSDVIRTEESTNPMNEYMNINIQPRNLPIVTNEYMNFKLNPSRR